MKKFIVLFLFFTQCAHYAPVQIVGGEQHKDKITLLACTSYILGFPAHRELFTISEATAVLGISEKEIYSIDASSWPYLFYIYGEHCLRFSMNSHFNPALYKNSRARAEQIALTLEQKKEEAMLREEATRYLEENAGKISGNWARDVDTCNVLEGQKRLDCLRQVNKFYIGKKAKK